MHRSTSYQFCRQITALVRRAEPGLSENCVRF